MRAGESACSTGLGDTGISGETQTGTGPVEGAEEIRRMSTPRGRRWHGHVGHQERAPGTGNEVVAQLCHQQA